MVNGMKIQMATNNRCIKDIVDIFPENIIMTKELSNGPEYARFLNRGVKNCQFRYY